MVGVVWGCAEQGSGFRVQGSEYGRSEVGGRESGVGSRGSGVVYLVLALFIGFGSLASAQQPGPQPASYQVTDQPAAEAEIPRFQPLNEPLPELPETEVTGRLNAFPAEALPADTVIAPNREPTPLSQTGSSVDVITSEQIDQISPRGGQTTVAEVLRGRLGVDVVRQGGPGSITSVFLRGANSNQTKVLLDGIPLNDPSNAGRSFDFSTLTVDNIERIEVLRGPQSMVYGSDAIGGVVNIVTQRGQGPLSIRATGFGGTYNTGQTALNVSAGDDQKYYSVTGSYYSTGGISAAAASNGNTEHDGFNLGNVNGRVGYNLGDTWNVDYVFRYVDAASKVDDFDFVTGLPYDNLIRKNLTKGFSNRVQLSNWLVDGLIQHRVGFNLVDYDRIDTDPGFSPPLFHGQTREVDYFASAQLTETNVLSGGANYHVEEAVSTFNPEVSQNLKGVFLQDTFQLGNFYGTAGARWDETSNSGTAQTYRVTGLYRIDPTGTAFHGSIGTGFRQPSLAENLFAFGNPNLRPEHSKGWDVGLRQSLWEDAVFFDATYFRNDFTDLIVFDRRIPPFGELANVGKALSSGVELNLQVYLTQDLWVTGTYTHDHTRNLDPASGFYFNQPLLRRPQDKLGLSLTRALPDYGASVVLQMLYVGSRLDGGPVVDFNTFETAPITLAPYMTLNLAANCQLTDAWSAYLRLDNITNTSYQEVSGYGAPLFGMYAGLNLVY